MTTAAAALAGAARTDVRRAATGWEVVGYGYGGRVLAIAPAATKAEALRLAAAATAR